MVKYYLNTKENDERITKEYNLVGFKFDGKYIKIFGACYKYEDVSNNHFVRRVYKEGE